MRKILFPLALFAFGCRAPAPPHESARAPELDGAPNSPSVIRLADELARATRVTVRPELVEPEKLSLQPGSVTAPAGFRLAPAPNAVARFVADKPTPLRVQLDVPVVGGRDYIVRAMVRDPAKVARLLVQHAPAPAEPEPGWHRATEERAGERARFDWREDVPPGRATQTVVLEADAATDVTLETFSLREAGARDPALVESSPAVALHGLVERPVDGVVTLSPRGARRLMPALLSAGDGAYEWPLAGRAASLEFWTATVPRGAAGARPVELRVEVDRGGGAWEKIFSEVRGGDGDGGGWRFQKISIAPGARALRLATRATPATGEGRSQVVAWGDATLLPSENAAAQKKHPPHVLLITLDAVRADHLSAYGYARPTSRFLAALAARGARFDDVTAQRGHTWASTTSLTTGLDPPTSGVIARGARPFRGTGGVVAEFARAGYLTGRVGSPDLPRGQIPGFDFAELADFDTDILSRVEAIGRAAGDRPLFLWVHLANAHYPWQVADEFNRFDPGYSGRFRSGLTRAEFRALENQPAIDEREKTHLAALYDGAILQMDTRLGRTLAALDDAGFFRDAIIAVTADHGTHLGEHGIWFMHSTPWHASLAVPLILVAPNRISAGLQIGADRGRALLIDLGPTLLDLAGVAPLGALDGISLRPLLNGARLPSRTTVTRFQPAGYARIENDRFALLYNPNKEPLSWPGELNRNDALPILGLYDRARDPDEMNDLSAQYPLIVGALRAEADAQEAAAAPPLSSEARQLLRQAGYGDDD